MSWCATLSLGACSLDSSGLGSSAGSIGSADSRGSSDDGGTSSSGAATTADDASASDGDPKSTTADVTNGPDTTSSDGESTSADPTVDDACTSPAPLTLVFTPDLGDVSSPMARGALFDGTQYVYGEEADAGSVTFPVELPCADEYMVWAEVYDAEPGPFNLPLYASDPADALRVSIGGIETEWRYGCQWDVFDTWGIMAVSASPDCVLNDKVVMSLVAGSHALTFTPLEGGNHVGGLTPGSVAAISRVFITNDLENPP